MIQILSGLNYSAIIITTLICFTVIRSMEILRRIARIWLEGLKTERDIQSMIHGKQRGGDRNG